eukprot:TRINITY_DN1653_c0_g1_i4.p3 TRINITY_DN1653_c0_g1~~TRINITY_DN1653_c0_g1_i4.p3  ORF type:complete len:126 (+),score=35.35 TRINITY_DN1653_c0_g1_i4:402-779(+)
MRKKEAAAKAKAKAKAAATKAKALAAQKKKAKEEAEAREARSMVSTTDSVVESEPTEDGDAGVWSRRPTPYMWALSATYTAIMPLPVVDEAVLELSGSCKVLVDSEVQTDDCPQAVACCVLSMIR